MKKDSKLQLLLENQIKIMLKYCFNRGLPLEKISQKLLGKSIDKLTHIEKLNLHSKLCKIISPARPQTLIQIDIEMKKPYFTRIFGPFPVVREHIILSILFLLIFIILNIIITLNHQNQILNEILFISVASLGACFGNLTELRKYVTNRSFDIIYQPVYRMKLILGILSGVFLSTLLYSNTTLGLENISRTLLALIGGFSSGIVYNLLEKLSSKLRF